VFNKIWKDRRYGSTAKTPKSATGPDIKQIFIGSEGTLCIITSAGLTIKKIPSRRSFLSFSFKGISDGLSAIREFIQEGARPPVIRLYDEIDTFIAGRGKGKKAGELRHNSRFERLISFIEKTILSHPVAFEKMANSFLSDCLLILVFEGNPRIIYTEEDTVGEICKKNHGVNEGEEPAKKWWDNRYSVSYGLSPVFYRKAFADTIEVSATWSNLEALYHNMRSSISKYAFVMAHFSHFYESGGNIYFTFVGTGKTKEEKIEKYLMIWDSAMDTCIKSGGSISHHHGIGLLKQKWMHNEHGNLFNVMKGIKGVIDRNNIMNPGKLF